MTTQQFGTLEPFDGADFTDYSERLNAYFIAHNIDQVAADASEAAKREADKKKVAVTISLIGKTVYMKSVKSSENSSFTPPLYKLTVTIEDQEVPMEVDTGSSVTLLSSAGFTKTGWQVTTLKPPTVLLKSYTGDIIQCLGEKEMDVKVGDQVGTLLIRVVQGPSLLGRDEGHDVQVYITLAEHF